MQLLTRHEFTKSCVLLVIGGMMLTATAAHGQQKLSFKYSNIAPVGGRTAIGDVDGDGRNDIVVHTWSSRRGLDKDGRITWSRTTALTNPRLVTLTAMATWTS